MKSQVEPKHYSSEKYDSKERFISYWHQINEVIKTKPKKVLEIGVGNNAVNKYLKNQNLNVTSLDMDGKLKPDKIGKVEELSKIFKENSFDTVLCAEVLEHIPFDRFDLALKDISKVTSKYAVISLPHFGLNFFAVFKLPKLEKFKFGVKIPFPKEHHFNGEHYWEIGKKGFSLVKIKKIMSKYFIIRKTYLVPEIPYHRFFVLEKIN